MIALSDFKIKNREYMEIVLRSGRLTYGPLSQLFEDKFSDAHDSEYGLFLNSGTSALQIALQTLKEIHGWKDGDEVIVPALTFVATVNIVLHCNLKPVLCDIDPITLNMDPNALEAKIGPLTRCVIPVHIMGRPCEMGRILDIAILRNLRVIEDSCETVFTEVDEKSVGTWGDIACFSTYAAHTLTSGVGGFAVTNNDNYADYMRSLMNHGRDTTYIACDDDKLSNWADKREVVASRYRFPRIGHSYRATEMEAAIGLDQFEQKDEIVRKRKQVMEWFNIAFEYGPYPDFHGLHLPFTRNDENIVPMMYPIICEPDKRTQVRDALEQAGVETRDIVQILHQPCYSGKWSPEDYPNANRISTDCLLVGCHQGMSQEDVELIVRVASEASLDG